MIKPSILLVTALPAAISFAVEAKADELQQQVLAAARATRPDAYGFRRTMAIERTGAPRRVIVEQFDPRRSAGERWSLVSVDGRPPSAKEAEQARKAKRGPTPSYADLAKWFGAPATRVAAAPGYVTYRFARLPKGAIKIGSHDASADVTAEALVNVRGSAPFVERVRLSSTKGFRMMLVASVKSMVLTGRYRLTPEGQPVPAESESDIVGSLVGKSGRLQSAVTFSDYRSVR